MAQDIPDMQVSYADVAAALNMAADDLMIALAKRGYVKETGLIDAVNLLINATGRYLRTGERDLAAVVEADGPYGDALTLDDVLTWITEGC